VLLILLVISLSGATAQCSCPGTCAFYDGSEAQCFCWAQQTANAEHKTGQVSWFPHAQFSSGGCKFCPTGPSSGTVMFYVQVGYCLGGSYYDGFSYVCRPYGGSEAGCMSWCEQTAKAYQFVGTYHCTYVPFGEFSQGGCSVTGTQNPCTVPPGHVNMKDALQRIQEEAPQQE